MLIQHGVIDAAALDDALARQQGRHPIASELYTLGYATERALCAALSAQTGWPAIVLDESTNGDAVLIGRESMHQEPHLETIVPAGDHEDREAQRALAEEAARNIERDDELPSEEPGASMTLSGDWQVNTLTTTRTHDDLVEERTTIISAELDRGDAADRRDGRLPRALVVDPDAGSRVHLVSILERSGYECHAAATGPQAVDLMQATFFELVFGDIATPELDGLRMCRAIYLLPISYLPRPACPGSSRRRDRATRGARAGSRRAWSRGRRGASHPRPARPSPPPRAGRDRRV